MLGDEAIAGIWLAIRLIIAIAIVALCVSTSGLNALSLGAIVGSIIAILYTSPARWYHKW